MNLTERVAQLFRDRPREWIDGRTLAAIGGYAGWRSRVAECRTLLGMKIENKVEYRKNLRISRYRWTTRRKAA